MPHCQLDYHQELANVAFEGRSENAFEAFVRSSLFGHPGKLGDLPDIPLEEILFASGCLGALATWGSDAPTDWHSFSKQRRVRPVGFEVLLKGEAGIADLIASLTAAKTKVRLCSSSPLRSTQKKIKRLLLSEVMGCVYDVINRTAREGCADYGRHSWLFQCLARSATEQRILEPGASLWGTPAIDTPYRSLVQIAKSAGMTIQSLRHALLDIGLIDEAQDLWSAGAIWIDLEAHRDLFDRLRSSRTMTEASVYLGIDVDLVSKLHHDGTLTPIVRRTSRDGKSLAQFTSDELDRVWERMSQGVPTIAESEVGDDYSPISTTAMRVGRNPQQIIDLLLAGSLKGAVVVQVKDDGSKTILLAVDKVRAHVRKPFVEGVVAVPEAAKLVSIDTHSFRHTLDVLGIDLTNMINNVNGRTQKAVRSADLQRFMTTYVSLRALARHTGLASGRVKSDLKAAGIQVALWQYAPCYARADFAGTRFARLADVGMIDIAPGEG